MSILLINHIFFLMSPCVSQTTDSIPPHALFLVAREALSGHRRWSTGVSVDAPPRGFPPSMTRFVLRRPWPVKVVGTISLSLLHVKVQESPPFLMIFYFGPFTFNFVYDPDFYYISFDLV